MTSTGRQRVAAAGVGLGAALLHARALGDGFVNWDDNRFITANPLFAAGGWTYVRAALTRVQFDAYHPLHLLSYLPDRWLWRDSPAGFHALNLLLLAVGAALLFTLCRRVAGSGAAAFATLLFAAHPLTVEPVEWVSGRKDLLAAAFFLGTLLIEDARPLERTRPSAAGLVLFVAALLSKSSALCLPPVLWCWLVWMRGASTHAAARRAAPYAALAAIGAVLVVTIWRSHQMIPPRPTAAGIDVLATLATYARRLLWPSDLAPLYPDTMPAPVLSAAVAGAALVAAAVTWRRWPAPARFALGAFLLALLPVANLVPVVFRFADRYAFLALVVLAPPAAVGLDALLRRRGLPRAAALGGGAVAAGALAFTTIQLGAGWRESRALWERATAAQPAAFMGRLKYGETLREAGDWSGAVREYQAAVRLRPDSSLGYVALFYLYAKRAEAEGRLPSGAADRWLGRLGAAIDDRARFDRLIAEVPHGACPPCANTLLLLNLRRWPRPDDRLLAAARTAVDAGLPDIALVFLSQARDQSAPAWLDLLAAARGARRTGE
ncbi:MAG TPA: hypothetical protein VHO67_16560 [Polyangia bacterium]|nr:hypothetical protein [Polyangia bacterium]